jgi:carboxyl-terminal processing protease
VRNSDYREFKTKNGRVVTDGGGVAPDIAVRELGSNDLITALQENQLIFDYATAYSYRNSYADISEFELPPETLNDFREFVGKSDFSFETETEKKLKEALTLRDEVVFNEAIESDFKSLLAKVEKQKFKAFDSNASEIEKLLEDEIVKRYFYREGLYAYYLDHDPSILAARELLGNTAKYRETLQ